MLFKITLLTFCDIASSPFLCRVCGLQALDMFDFQKEYRFQGIWQGSRFRGLERSKNVLADDSMAVALMAELLHRGADANHAIQLVSFCLQIDGCCLIDISTVPMIN